MHHYGAPGGKTMGKPWENHGKTMGKSVILRKTHGKPWFILG
jgi:hypothetical protein